MALKVQTGLSTSTKVKVGEQAPINTNLQKVEFSLVNLEKLKNVDPTTNGLEDGYTLIYNANSETWVTQTFSASLGNIDGGTY